MWSGVQKSFSRTDPGNIPLLKEKIIRGFYLSIRQKSSTRPLVTTINIRGILQPMMRIPNVVLRSVVDNGTVLVKICVVHS